MSARESQCKNSPERHSPVGLVANGSAGPWEVAIDETVSGAERWFLQVEGPTIYVYFQIDGPQMVDRLLDFLEARRLTPESPPDRRSGEPASELEVGVFDSTPVFLTWDQERNDGWTILLAGAGGSNLRFWLSIDDGKRLADALELVRNDLCEIGLLSSAS